MRDHAVEHPLCVAGRLHVGPGLFDLPVLADEEGGPDGPLDDLAVVLLLSVGAAGLGELVIGVGEQLLLQAVLSLNFLWDATESPLTPKMRTFLMAKLA